MPDDFSSSLGQQQKHRMIHLALEVRSSLGHKYKLSYTFLLGLLVSSDYEDSWNLCQIWLMLDELSSSSVQQHKLSHTFLLRLFVSSDYVDRLS